MLGGIITLGGGIAWAASFLALAPKHTARFVFTQFINNSGYTSKGWVGIMSFYTPIYALYGTDGILHIAEEMRDAERSAPVCWPTIADIHNPVFTLIWLNVESHGLVHDFQWHNVSDGGFGYGILCCGLADVLAN